VGLGLLVAGVLVGAWGGLQGFQAAPWFVFGVLAPVVMIRSAQRPGVDPFHIVKGISVAVASLLIAACGSGLWAAEDVWATLVVVVFWINIAEAVLSAARLGHHGNALVGAGLLVTLPGSENIFTQTDNTLMFYTISHPWILAYTLWNISFVIVRSPWLARVHAGVLLAPILIEGVWPGLWAQARAYTLGTQQMLSTGSPAIARRMDIHGWEPQLRRLVPWFHVLAWGALAWNYYLV